MASKRNDVKYPSPSLSPDPEPSQQQPNKTDDFSISTTHDLRDGTYHDDKNNGNELDSGLDALTLELESYLAHLDAYTSATSAIQELMSAGFFSLAKARMGTGLGGGSPMGFSGLIGIVGVDDNMDERARKMKEKEGRRREQRKKVDIEREHAHTQRTEAKGEDIAEDKKTADNVDGLVDLSDTDILELCDWAKRVTLHPSSTEKRDELETSTASISTDTSVPTTDFNFRAQLIPPPSTEAAKRTGRTEPGPLRDWFGGSATFNPELRRAKVIFESVSIEIGKQATSWWALKRGENRVRELRMQNSQAGEERT